MSNIPTVTIKKKVVPPETVNLLGQFMVAQKLESAATRQAMDAIGKGIVLLRLGGTN